MCRVYWQQTKYSISCFTFHVRVYVYLKRNDDANYDDYDHDTHDDDDYTNNEDG
jgi:hypothetical protein